MSSITVDKFDKPQNSNPPIGGSCRTVVSGRKRNQCPFVARPNAEGLEYA